MAKRLAVLKPREVGFMEMGLGELAPTGIEVKNTISGISHGTEMVAYLGKSPHIDRAFTGNRLFEEPGEGYHFYPHPYCGYDSVGIVQKAGAQVKGIRPGDRVWHSHPHQDVVHVDTAGEVFVLPPEVNDEEAIMLNMTAIGLAAVLDANIKLGDHVVIFGAGVLGQIAMQMSFLDGAGGVCLVDVLPERLEAAARICPEVTPINPSQGMAALQIREKLGAFPDVVIEFTGSPAGLHSAIQAAGINGTVVAAGFYAAAGDQLRLSEEFLHNRVTLKASMSVWGCQSRYPERWDRRRILAEALRLIRLKKLDLSSFRSEKVPFAEASRAYQMIEKEPQKHLKMALTY